MAILPETVASDAYAESAQTLKRSRLAAQLADVDAEGWDADGVQGLGAHCFVGAQERAEKPAVQVQVVHRIRQRELRGRC